MPPTDKFTTADQRWAAVTARDRAADGNFVFAVKTTGVYCRPSCSSRSPKRRNVIFFDSPVEAEKSGFRPCKKCRPAAACRVPDAIVVACRLLDGEPMSLAELSDEIGVSPFHLQRTFKEHIGMSPRKYAAMRRTKRLDDALLAAPSVSRAMAAAGFSSSSRLYETAGDLGMSPRESLRGGMGISIRHTVEPCALGLLLVAATQRGICRIELGDSPEALENSLRARFPNADFIAGDAEFSKWVSQMIALVETPAKACHLPLDIQGTAFQLQVWNALRAIPPGKTATYTEIAERIGRPTSARAVAQACGANPTAVIVPCHRVIGADGELRGFRWGVERKRELLRRER